MCVRIHIQVLLICAPMFRFSTMRHPCELVVYFLIKEDNAVILFTLKIYDCRNITRKERFIMLDRHFVMP